MMAVLEELERALVAKGVRITPPRRAVLAAIASQGEQFTADDVLKRTPGAGRATVFRTIRLLHRLGLLCRVLQEDGRLRYSVAGSRRHHHHLVCLGCGRVQDLDECALAPLSNIIARRTGYSVEGHWLEIYGRCLQCQEVSTRR
jgi:Fe2+ or Zn2+ uptake regulation protein